MGESLNKICQDEDMPGLRTVHDWLSANSVFSAQYSRAREIQADTLADRAVDRAHASDKDDAPAARVYLDAVKWFAGVVSPRKYTPKQANTTELTGPNGGPVQISRIELVALK